MEFVEVAETGPASDLLVYESGWQSWSPAGIHPATGGSPRPPDRARQVTGYRPDTELPGSGFQGEGLLAVGPREGGEARIWYALRPDLEVPSIRARASQGRLLISGDGPVEEMVVAAPSLEAGLASWADRFARHHCLPPVGSLPPVWCSWYAYFAQVRAAGVTENLAAAARLGLPIGVIQVDDGHEAEIGDWLSTSPRFGRPLVDVAAEIRGAGYRAGIWIAPLLAGERSRLLTAHQGWMVEGADPARHWDQRLGVLDVTHPDAADWLAGVFRKLSEWGFDYFKLDFLYAGALPGRRHQDASPIEAYRQALLLIRDAAGSEATLLGCGAPLLPSAGLVDAMRVGPDIATNYEPRDGEDLTSPSQRGAALAVGARAFLHGRFWINDPDCLVARPEMERREEWAAIVERHGGLRASGDPLDALDRWGLETTRRLLTPSSPLPLVHP